MKCLNCEKETKIFGKRHNKYCDLKCKREFESKKLKKVFKEIKCSICDTVFMPVSKANKFCCHRCSDIHDLRMRSKKPDTKNCKLCNTQFKPYNSLDKFCSANCRVEHMKSKRTKRWKDVSSKIGKNNAAYVHGLRTTGAKKSLVGFRKYYRIRNKKNLKMIEEYGFMFCEVCKRSNTKLETHHIVFRSEKLNHEEIHNERNLITVCVKCHNNFHGKKSSRNYLIEQRNLTELFGMDILRL